MAGEREYGRHCHETGRHQNSGGASRQKEHDGLGEEVAHQASPVGARGQPNGHFIPSSQGTGEEEIGDVGASDEEYGTHDRDQDDPRDPDLGPCVFAPGSPVSLGQSQDLILPSGIFKFQLGDNGGQVGLSSFQIEIGFETSDHSHPTVVGIVETIRRQHLGLHHHGHPHVLIPEDSFENRGHDSH